MDFELFLSITISLTVKSYFINLACQRKMMIMVTKLHPTNHLHNSNQAK